jgi:lysophospholipase L1-like esterase
MPLAIGIGLGTAFAQDKGGGGGPYRAKAQSILAAMAAGGSVPISSDIPTYSEGTGFANSTLNNATDKTATLKPLDAAMTRLGLTFVTLTAYGIPYTVAKANNPNDYTIGTGNGGGYRFRINATAFDAFVCSDGGAMTIKVNGAFLPTIYHTSGTFGYRKFTFPNKAVRDIEFYIDSGQVVAGFNVAAIDTISALPLPALPKSMIFGDSYTEGLYTITTGGYVDASDYDHCNTFPVRLRELMGLPGMFLQGRGGQGAVAVSSGQSFLSRALAGDFTQNGSDMDLVIIYNTINDGTQTVATVQANWQTIITRLMADQPNAIILGFTGFKTAGAPVDAAHNSAFLNAFNAVKDASRMKVWDGNDQIFNSGNFATYIAGDGIHPNTPGATFSAGIVKSQFQTLLQSF